MTASATVLLAHDGELDDVLNVLQKLGTEFEERRGEIRPEDHATQWAVVIGSPRRVLELQVGAAGTKPTRVAMLEGDSKTLIAMLRRSGIDLMVQRPVHPAALRLLILHALYAGPEKRKHQRITVGAPVRYRVGLLKHAATLADVSLRGCRLLSSGGVKRDQKIRVFFGSELGGSKSFSLAGRVVRSGPTEGADGRTQAIAVSFDVVTREETNLLKQVLRAHVSGPHVLERAADGAKEHFARTKPAAASSTPVDAATEAPERGVRESDPRCDAPAAPELGAQDAAQAQAEAERREATRHEIDRHVIALGVEATRVLIGRDISVGGMRVAANDTLEIGDELRIALHVRARSEPLVVCASVVQDYGEEGVGLEFNNLSESAENYLRKMVNILPILAARGGDEGSGVVVSEILERSDGPGRGLAPEGAGASA